MKVNSSGRILKWKNTPNKYDSDEVKKFKKFAYKKWSHMMTRCYSENYQNKMPTYKGCTVSEEWKDFDSFYEDFIKIPNSNRLDYELDKDILVRGNRVYSKNTCCMIPRKINALMFKPKKDTKLPTGITRCHYNPKIYIATISLKGKNISLIRTKNLDEAFQAYKKAKEAEIKRVAEAHREVIDENVYKALITWEVKLDA